MSFDIKLEKILANYRALGDKLAEGTFSDNQEFIRFSKEYSDLGPLAHAISERLKVLEDLANTQKMISSPDMDADLMAMAQDEHTVLQQKIVDLEHRIKILLLPKDVADEKNAILEIRAGTGGEEAALFAADLFRMYQRYSEIMGWRVEIMDMNQTELAGIKEVQMGISGRGVFARLKFESGVHRVQRVPTTETGGRIHTSAATVAVLPEAEDVDIKIDEKDLRIDIFRSSGPGGQSVNTTDSAVRITHLPTGIVVQQQDERSQHKNKAKAMKILRARLYDAERQKAEAERAQSRKSQVGSGDRSERIRTYNFPQGRVTDHRINLTLYKLDRVLDGSALDEMIQALIDEDQASRLADVGSDTD